MSWRISVVSRTWNVSVASFSKGSKGTKWFGVQCSLRMSLLCVDDYRMTEEDGQSFSLGRISRLKWLARALLPPTDAGYTEYNGHFVTEATACNCQIPMYVPLLIHAASLSCTLTELSSCYISVRYIVVRIYNIVLAVDVRLHGHVAWNDHPNTCHCAVLVQLRCEHLFFEQSFL